MSNNLKRREKTFNINKKATARNGRDLCEQMHPIIQARIKQTKMDVISSTSLIKVIKNEAIKSRLEKLILDRIEWEDDPVTWFINKLHTMQQEHPIEGEYLIWKYYLDMSDTEYCYTYNVSTKTMQRIKEKAHILVAIETGCHEYEYQKVLKIRVN